MSQGTDYGQSVLIYGDTVRSPQLRHEIPHSVADAFLYAEHEGSRYAVVRSLEVERMAAVPGLQPLPFEAFGFDELVSEGVNGDAAILEVIARACEEIGVREATVPA